MSPHAYTCFVLGAILFHTAIAADRPSRAKDHNTFEFPPLTDKASIQRLSLDLKKDGDREELLIFFEKFPGTDSSSCGPLGELHLRRSRNFGDDFHLGSSGFAETSVLTLSDRNVLLIKTCGGGAAGGNNFQAFSVDDDHQLYRVQLRNSKGSTTLNFSEYTSAGTHFLIRFIDGGSLLRTITTPINQGESGDARTFTEYRWNGLDYAEVKTIPCRAYACPGLEQ